MGRISDVRLFQKKNGFWYVQVDRDHKRSLNTRDLDDAILKFNAFQTELLKGKIRALDEGKRISLKTFRDFSYLFRKILRETRFPSSRIRIFSLSRFDWNRLKARTASSGCTPTRLQRRRPPEGGSSTS